MSFLTASVVDAFSCPFHAIANSLPPVLARRGRSALFAPKNVLNETIEIRRRLNRRRLVWTASVLHRYREHDVL
jgi:hypothetical protein